MAMADRVLLVPTLWPGLSTHHMHFPGTLDVPQKVYIQLITELGKSLVEHGRQEKSSSSTATAETTRRIRAALRELKTDAPQREFVFASYWTLAAKTLSEVRESEMGGMGHACEMETSIMLHLNPERVKMDRAVRDGPPHTDPLSQGRHAARPARVFRQRVSRSHQKRRHRPSGSGLGRKRKTLSRWHRGGSFGVYETLFDVGSLKTRLGTLRVLLTSETTRELPFLNRRKQR